jgi:hypothetical protein
MGTGNIGAGLRRRAGTRRVRAVAVAVTGAAAVAAAIGLAVPAGASAAVARPAAVSGAEHFQLITLSPTATTLSVTSWGVDTMAGVDHEGSSNTNTATDKLVYPKGTFKVTHTGPVSFKMNSKTCFLTATGKGTIKISGGTGAYKGISGKGTFSLTVIGIAPKTKTGACNGNGKPAGFQEVITANATVKLP